MTRPRWKQIHGIRLAEATARGQDCGEADALFTRVPRLPIGVRHADCVPILMARADGLAVAAIHAGWRGTLAGISGVVVECLRARGENPASWLAEIGPSARPCCYEVSEDLAQRFAHCFKGVLAAPAPRRIDLQAINQAQLLAGGICQVEVRKECTICAKNADGRLRYESFRRDRTQTRQFSAIMLLGEPGNSR